MVHTRISWYLSYRGAQVFIIRCTSTDTLTQRFSTFWDSRTTSGPGTTGWELLL